jgi:putative tricarboxylic transport membrane protein
MAVLGAFATRERADDIFLALGFGVAGYFLKKHGWPRLPLVLALTLGGMLEANAHITLRLSELGRLNLFARPIVLVLLALTLLELVLPFLARGGEVSARDVA